MAETELIRMSMEETMIAVIDNYDSFTYNLVQYLGELGAEVRVFRNDAITVDDLEALQPEPHRHLPGPGRPRPMPASPTK